ncbi:MAG TPA: hypothetical protein DG753_03195 [Clostridium sp.]|nr:hypothetical protein [Clostridium sp.]
MKKTCFFILTTFLLLSLTGCSMTKSRSSEKYLNSGKMIDIPAKKFMPDLDMLPIDYGTYYKYNHIYRIIFETDTLTLVVNYSEETYTKEKERLLKEYKYLDHKVISDLDSEKYYIPEYEFKVSTYDFKVADQSETYKDQYPKSFGMIGFSDENKSIAYLYFYDTDLDYISRDNESPMSDFVKKYFKYDF